MTPIGVVSTIPADPPGTGTAAQSFEMRGNNALEVSVKASVGSGDVVALRWFGDLAKWLPWKPDRPLSPDVAKNSGYASGVYLFGVLSRAHFLLWNTVGAGLTLSEAYAESADYRFVY